MISAFAWRRGLHGHRLVLVGIGVGAILTGLNGYLLTRTQMTDAARAVLWLTGSLDGRGWEDAHCSPAGAVLLVGADWVAQRLVTGVPGGGDLIWLLVTERRAGRI
ncbi:ABC-type enterobactin transport system permease subunit [Planotetraspora sp. GP83]